MLCTHPREAQRAEICLRHFGGYAGDITLTILESSALGGVKRRGSRLEPAPPSVGYSIHTFSSLRVVPYLMRRKASMPIRITFGPGFP